MIDHTLGRQVRAARTAIAATKGDAVRILQDSGRFVRVISIRTLTRIESGEYRKWASHWTEQLRFVLQKLKSKAP